MEQATYWYCGRDAQGRSLRLPRTLEVEDLARSLMAELAGDDRYGQEGKMYGLLLAETAGGDRRVLRAFSGLLNGRADWPGWVPTPGRELLAIAEADILAQLESMKQRLIQLANQRSAARYPAEADRFAAELAQLNQRHDANKVARDRLRQSASVEISEDLDRQSRADSRERRLFKQERDRILVPLKAELATIEAEIQTLKRQRKGLSRRFQADLQAHYRLRNFAGESRSIAELWPRSPTGTGDCCAPKLLQQAAVLGLKPLAMAEFWWGPAQGDRKPGEFYGACTDRCQPIMGFLLSGLISDDLVRLYEDEWLIAIEKPAGLLSVPGRGVDRQDSVLSRLGDGVWPLHRLDQDTSGLLLLARDRDSYRQVAAQFAQGQVTKTYEAILAGSLLQRQGRIELPLWSDPDDRPYQRVDGRGRPSLTDYQVLAHWTDRTRVRFWPRTGRTHQLRVHARSGLGAAILGDRLYGVAADRLYLHATEVGLMHPRSGERLTIRSAVPF
jgi:tRNA pseudouridine32 synthase / 23S rRNA pseudouridine746 synthase